MPKTNISSNQPSFFHRDIPQPHEGYYSYGPNSTLRNFVEEHTNPYDDNSDSYSIEDFSAELIGNRHSAEYNFLGYSSKKPYEPIREYIEHFTKQDDLVLDSFCGSGGVGYVCASINRKAILIDISPLATLTSSAYVTPIEIQEIEMAFTELEKSVKEYRNGMYGTKCHLCDGEAEVTKVIYSQTYRCLKCFETIMLADCENNKCPLCGEPISNRQKRLGQRPWMSEIICQEGCKGVLTRKYNDERQKARQYFQADTIVAKDLDLAKKIRSRRMMDYVGAERRWGLLWRPYHEDIQSPADFFTSRNLNSIISIKNGIDQLSVSIKVKRLLSLGLASIIPSVSKQQRYYPGSTFPNMAMPGVLYTPPINEEINVFKRFFSKRRTLIGGLKSINSNVTTPDICISTQSALDLSQISDNTIDYVFTDPPYSGRIQYGELNFIEESLLGIENSWLSDEIIVNEFRGFDIDEWASRLKKAMLEIFRVLKPGRWISVCYHDSEVTSWLKLQDLMLEVGFIPGENEGLSSMETGWQTLKMHTSTDITKRDLVINFRKPRIKERLEGIVITGNEDTTSFTDKARAILTEALGTHPGSATDRLYDILVSRMVRKGEFERHNFDELLHSVAEEVGNRWYLLATADQVDEVESKKETASASRLETFVQKYLKEHPDELGVHYSDLFEQYLPIKDKPRRLLQDWLPEFFFKTAESTWRPPATDEERQQKAALRSSGALRRIKRFTNALLDGNPPYDRDKPENAATMADWIRQCRRAGFYDLGRALYEKGGLQFSELNEEAQLQVEEDYQICVRRSESPVKPASKGHQLPLVEE